MGANVKMSQAMAKTSKTMTNMNKMMNPAHVAKTMQEFDMANTKCGMTEVEDRDEIGIEISGKVGIQTCNCWNVGI